MFLDLNEILFDFAERQRLASTWELTVGLHLERPRSGTRDPQASRLRAKKLKARGKCIACLRPADKTMCAGCTGKYNARRRARVAELKAACKCVVCKQPTDGSVRCAQHAAAHNARRLAKRAAA